LLDYAEGNLPEDLIPEMKNFLLLNPDIQEELELFTEALVEDVSIEFPDKMHLKQIPLEKSDAKSDDFQRFCVAYIEGWMTDYEMQLFEKSVQKDAHKKKELHFFRHTILPAVPVYFDEKILLKQNETNPKINAENFESYCIACIEGWLNQTQLVAINRFIEANPEKQRVLELYKKTKLVPDVSIFYPEKRKLKRFSLVNPVFRKYFSHAASAAAILIFGLMVYYSSEYNNQKQLVGNITHVSNTNTSKNTTLIVDENQESVNEKPKNDLFGFNKIKEAGNEAIIIEQESASQPIQPITPITLASLECSQCKEVFDGKQTIQNRVVARIDTNSTYISDEKSIEEPNKLAAKSNLLKDMASAGLSGINKLTNGKLSIMKSSNNQKTKIAVNTRYFAFSTNIKTRNK
jgi:hypothetical protein